MSLFIGLNATSTATTGGLVYKGSYNATTNSPDLTSSTKGDFYIVSVAGTLAGVALNVGDHIVFNQDASSPLTSAMFDVIDNTDAVASVNGQTGPVVLDLQDINDVNASLSPSDSTFLVGDGSEWIGESGATARTSLGLGSAATLEAGANTANQLVQLTAAGKLPAVDGSLLTNLPGGGDMLSTNNLSDVADVTAARSNLGLTIGTNVQAFDAQLTDVAGLTPTDGNIIIGNGSNFITESGATARTSLGLGSAATLEAGANTANQLVQLTATGKLPAVDGSLLTNVTATDSTKLAIANDLSDLNDAGTARTHLGLEIGSDVQAFDAQLTDVAGLTPADGAFIVGDGSNFVTETGTTARTSLGLGTAAIKNTGTSNGNVVVLDSIGLPAVDGRQLTNVTATDSTKLAIANDLSDLNDAGTARTHLGLAIGSDVQAFDAQLTDVAGLTPADGAFIVGDGSNFVTESGATARTSLGLAIGSDVQAYDAQLTDIAGLTPTDSHIIVGDGSNFVTESGATARTSLGLTIGSDVQAYNARLADVAGLTPGDGAFIVGDGTNFTTETGSTVRSTLGLGSAAILTAGPNAFNVVQLNSYAQLPALDGSLLQNVTATSTDTLNDVVGRGATTSTPITVGDLKINSNAAGTSTSGSIATLASNNNIKLDPHGSGVPELVGNSTRGSGQIKFNCEQNSHGIVLKGPPHSAGASYTMILPDGLGTAGQYLKLENASTGELAFDTPSGGGGGSVPTVTTDSSGSDSTISTYTGIEEVHLISNGSTAVSITIPAASTVGNGYKYNIKRLGTNNVTITTATPASDGQIDGSNTYVLVSNNESVTLVSDNSNYYII